MKYNLLGQTGLLVSELCMGTMTFGGRESMWGAIGKLEQEEANGIIDRALEAGINFFDTANVYSEGASEEILGKALGTRRKEVIVATKVLGVAGKGPNDRGLSRGHIMHSVEASLTRLGTDYIDLYQIHGFDPLTPLEETLRTLDDLVRTGKVRYIGCSNLAAWQLMKALGISDKHDWARFESLQAYYTLAGRDLERDLVPLLQDQKLGLMVWSPLAGGFLSGKFGREQAGPEGARRVVFDFPPIDRERAYTVIDVMRDIATQHDVSVAQVALGWLLHQPVVTTVIIGAKSVAQLDDNLKSPDLKLSQPELDQLNAASALPTEYPGWMITRQSANRAG